jgi:hypothetical protein
MILLAIIKIVDNIITTAKSITVYQNKKIITSLLVVLSQFMFYFIVESIINDSSFVSTVVVCICSGIGTYFAMFINDRFKKDTTYTNILTCDSTDHIDDMCDYLLEHGIKYVPVDSYNREGDRTKTILAFAQTKYESKLIDDFLLNTETKYLRQILR